MKLKFKSMMVMAAVAAGTMFTGATASADTTYDYLNVGTKASMTEALDALNNLKPERINDNPSQAGYKRTDQFASWKRTNADYGWAPEYVKELPAKCDTRKAVLIMSAMPGTLEVSPNFQSDCKFKGSWKDGYGEFKDNKNPSAGLKELRVTENPTEMQIDHIVALGDAYRSGANAWGEGVTPERLSIANDPLNLAVSAAAANNFKSDKGPSNYLPPSEFGCEYAERYTKVKEKYNLTYTQADVDALKGALTKCVA